MEGKKERGGEETHKQRRRSGSPASYTRRVLPLREDTSRTLQLVLGKGNRQRAVST